MRHWPCTGVHWRTASRVTCWVRPSSPSSGNTIERASGPLHSGTEDRRSRERALLRGIAAHEVRAAEAARSAGAAATGEAGEDRGHRLRGRGLELSPGRSVPRGSFHPGRSERGGGSAGARSDRAHANDVPGGGPLRSAARERAVRSGDLLADTVLARSARANAAGADSYLPAGGAHLRELTVQCGPRRRCLLD